MKYDIVSERTAPTYRISAPADIYGALKQVMPAPELSVFYVPFA